MDDLNNNWFSDALPTEYKIRSDGKYNVWNLSPLVIDNELELKWQVIAVCDSEDEAKEFVALKN